MFFKKICAFMLSGVMTMTMLGGNVFLAGSDNDTDVGFSDYIELPDDNNVSSVHSDNLPEACTGSELEEYYVTPDMPSIRNQNPYGTCWAFSGTALAELSILRNENIALDLSELHLVYFTYSSGSGDPLGLLNDTNQFIGNNILNYGGNTALSYNALANWKGAESEEELPYGEYAADALDNTIDPSLEFDSVAHLRNMYKVNVKSDWDETKKLIKQYGAVGVSYKDLKSNYNSTYNSMYSTATTGSGHAIAIVGWDDNFPKEHFNTTAPGDGAWLIRNSWGSNNYSRYGYFWMSYYDPTINSTGYAFDFVSNENDEFYDNNYQYDGTCYSSSRGCYNTATIANVFTAQKQYEKLRAISFNVASVNVNYEVSVYKLNEKNLENDTYNPEDGELVASKTGSTSFEGLYNVKFDKPVMLKQGDVFSVVVKLSKIDGGYVYFNIDYNSSVSGWYKCTATANPNESFIKYGSSWSDFGKSNNSNIRIKAYTDNVDTSEYAEISFADSKYEVKEGKNITLNPVIEPETAAVNIEWTSDDEMTAKVENGVVTGVKAGTTQIIAQLENGNTAKCTVEVSHIPVVKEGKAATCTDDGYTDSIVCEYCGEILTPSEVIPTYGHSIYVYSQTEADYGINSTITYKCKNCDYSYTVKNSDALTMSAPGLESVANTLSGIQFKWKACADAEGYYVYRKEQGGSWAKIGTLTGTTFLDKNVSDGIKYTYTVKAYKGRYISPCIISGKSAIRLSQPNFRLENLNAGIKITWDKVTGADKYYLYRREEGNNAWTRIATVSSDVSSYTDVSANENVIYYYTIKANNDFSLSSCHQGRKMIRIQSGKITYLAKSGADRAVVRWLGCDYASGYQVRCATLSNMSDALSYSSTNTALTAKTLFSLTKGNTYYVQVRNYVIINNFKYYGGWSEKKSVVIS